MSGAYITILRGRITFPSLFVMGTLYFCIKSIYDTLFVYINKNIHDFFLLLFLPSDGILDSIDCLHIMLTTIQPSWLKMCVSEILLQDYDDCLVLSQYKAKAKESLSLEKLVS